METILQPGDYVLPPGESIWVRVGDAVIYIRNRGDATDVEAYSVGQETETPFESFTIYSDAED